MNEICGPLDGMHFTFDDVKEGATVPPMHPNCRCCLSPWYTDDEPSGNRGARNPETGKWEDVPDMKYDDWKDIFVDKKTSLQEWKETLADKKTSLQEPIEKDWTPYDTILGGIDLEKYALLKTPSEISNFMAINTETTPPITKEEGWALHDYTVDSKKINMLARIESGRFRSTSTLSAADEAICKTFAALIDNAINKSVGEQTLGRHRHHRQHQRHRHHQRLFGHRRQQRHAP